jgi:hypothetical protein
MGHDLRRRRAALVPVKTDRREAEILAKLHSTSALTAVRLSGCPGARKASISIAGG